MIRKLMILFSVYLFFAGGLSAQNSPETLVKELAKKLQQVDKYSADILVKIDVEFVNIEERKGKVFFEKPDKFEIKTTGILLLPKKGVEMEYLRLLTQEFTAIDEKTEEVNGIQSRLIKVIPMGNDLDIVLARMWIDEKNMRIARMNTFTKSSGTYTIDFSYSNNPFDLPSAIRVEFDVKNMSLPSSMTGDLESLSKNLDKKGVSKGVVDIQYSNYVVN